VLDRDLFVVFAVDASTDNTMDGLHFHGHFHTVVYYPYVHVTSTVDLNYLRSRRSEAGAHYGGIIDQYLIQLYY